MKVGIYKATANGGITMSLEQFYFDEKNTIFIFEPITDEVAAEFIQKIFVLAERNKEPIRVIISSPGGEVGAGYAIIDAMHAVRNTIITIATGMVASMAALVLASGDYRQITKSAKVMIHQPLISGGGPSGQASDISILAKDLNKTKEAINKLLAEKTNQPIEVIERDTDRNTYMTSEETINYHLCDEIIERWERQ